MRPNVWVRFTVLAALLLSGSAQAIAQEPAKEEARPTGLPKKVNWTFNLDAGAGMFGFGNSLYTNVRPDPSGDLSDNWFEGFVKPALSGTYATGQSELYAKASVVGERTYGTPPSLVGESASSFKEEDLYIGWRSGKAMGTTENVLDLTVGRTQYRIGHGFLVWDGGGEGGSRGGFWSNARKAWQFAGIGRLKPGRHTIEGFYLDRDEVPEGDTKNRMAGANYELALNENNTLGASYLAVTSDIPERDGMDVFNVRAYVAPLKKRPNLTFEGEYAREDNGDLMESSAWTAQAAYEFGKSKWKPRLSYRYAFFEGDDTTTTATESFDPLFLGFYDWGTWWQGEIGGEYFLSNSNLVSHQVRLHVAPSDAVSGGLIGYAFRLDKPESFAPGVTSKDIASEIDLYVDWKINSNFIASFIGAFADPQEAAEQGYGRTDTFTYGMAYLAYSY